MQQFDVCTLRDGHGPLVVVLQHDLVDLLDTRVVAPLSDRPYRKLIDRLRVPVDLGGERYVVQLDRLAAIEKRSIDRTVGSLEHHGEALKNALDLLFLGV